MGNGNRKQQSASTSPTGDVIESSPTMNSAAALGISDTVIQFPTNDRVTNPDPEKEVASSVWFGVQGGIVDLITNYDAHSRLEYGDEIYEEMEANDTEVSKCFNLLKISVVSDNYSIAPAVALKENPLYDDAVTIQSFCQRAIDNAGKPRNGTPFLEFCEQLMDAVMYGHKIGEQTYEFGAGEDKDRLLLKYLKVKPQKSIGIAVDEFMNILGFRPLLNRNAAKTATGTADTRDDKSQLGSANDDAIYARDKFVLFTLRKRDQDPRGHSAFRAGVMAYKSKQRIAPEYLRYLLQCSIPGIVIIAPETEAGKGDKAYETKDGEIVKDPVTNKPKPISRVQRLVTEGVKFRNSSVMALEHGGDIKVVEMKGDGSQFRTARDVFNEDIEMSILFNILATSQGKYQARSASQTHMEVQEIVIAYLREKLISCITSDVFIPLVQKNFGEKFLNLVPKLSFGDTERRNFDKDGRTVASLAISKFLHWSQYPMLDQLLGIPQRDPEQWAAYAKKQEAMMEAKMQADITRSKGNGQGQRNGGGGSRKPKNKKGTSNPSPNTDPKRAEQGVNA